VRIPIDLIAAIKQRFTLSNFEKLMKLFRIFLLPSLVYINYKCGRETLYCILKSLTIEVPQIIRRNFIGELETEVCHVKESPANNLDYNNANLYIY